MESQEIMITTVARVVTDGDISDVFIYRQKKYKKLIAWNDFDEILGELNFFR